MSNLKFHSFLMLRTPAFSYSRYSKDEFQKCLEVPVMRSAIQLASRSLYSELEKRDFQIKNLDRRSLVSLQKYFNRMCFRPTPFGLFSAISPVSWDERKTSVRLSSHGELFLQSDFIQAVIDFHEVAPVGLFQTIFYSNNTIYRVGNSCRYLIRKRHQPFGKEHGIQQVKLDGVLNLLLKFCTMGRSGAEILAFLDGILKNEDMARDYLIQVVDAQLLISEFVPNVVGMHYGKRMAERLKRNSGDTLPFNFSKVEVENEKVIIGRDSFYGVYKKNAVGGVSAQKYQPSLLEGLNCLEKLSTADSPALLTEFRERFTAKFQDREVPLLVALDPELGVGYGKMHDFPRNDDFCSGVLAASAVKDRSVLWGAAQEMLMRKWTGDLNRAPTDPIVINPEDLKPLPEPDPKYPPGLNVVFRLVESDKVLIEQAGGITGTALHARFTPFDPKILTAATDMAEMEKRQNQEVLFAEIGYFNNERAANVNLREHIFGYEIPVLTHSTRPFENQIFLNDLQVLVVNSRVVLRSRKLDKQIIPIHPSAYNYHRSELAVYRFLCDLQYQDVKSNFGVSLKRMFPNLSFYPRIEHGKCILSPACWVLDKSEIEAAVSGPEGFLQVVSSRKLPRIMALAYNDQQLVLDLGNKDEVAFLIECLRKESRVELVEFFQPDQTVKDGYGKPFVGQFIASLYNDRGLGSAAGKTCPEGRSSRNHPKTGKVTRIFSPGLEWVYLKIYCHDSVSDTILRKYVEPVIRELRMDGIIDYRYFVRFKDPESHLRIRIRKIGQSDTDCTLKRLSVKLAPLLKRGTISSIAVETYIRELERYGDEVIGEVEAYFSASSDVVIENLRTNNDASERRLSEAFRTADLILTILSVKREQKRVLLQSIYANMSREFQGAGSLKPILDTKYRRYRGLIHDSLVSRPKKTAGIISLDKVLRKIREKSGKWPADRQLKLVGDLLHMHMNRVFASDQRKNEFIVYYLLEKYYRSERFSLENLKK